MRIPQNIWHPVLLSTELTAKPKKLRRFGVDFAFWRDATGAPQAFFDRCPHLGASLSLGSVRAGKLICPFHGFEFAQSGTCVHIPANGVAGKIPANLACTKFSCVEVHGFIWMWTGSQPAQGIPAYFSEIAAGFALQDIALDAPVNYSRAIENQLDAAHLPFVHRTTIGRGGKTMVDGPYVEASENGLDSWVLNRIDDGQISPSQDQLRERARERTPSLQLRYPAQWLLNISDQFKNLIAFVPIDDHTTRFYLRICHKVRLPVVRQVFEWVMQYANKVILNQDLRVITHLTPASSLDAAADRLIGADRAISIYRHWLAKNAREFVAQAPRTTDESSESV